LQFIHCQPAIPVRPRNTDRIAKRIAKMNTRAPSAGTMIVSRGPAHPNSARDVANMIIGTGIVL